MAAIYCGYGRWTPDRRDQRWLAGQDRVISDERNRDCLGSMVERTITGERTAELDRLAGGHVTVPMHLIATTGPSYVVVQRPTGLTAESDFTASCAVSPGATASSNH